MLSQKILNKIEKFDDILDKKIHPYFFLFFPLFFFRIFIWILQIPFSQHLRIQKREFNDNWRENYNEYLNSELWQEKRRQVIERDRGVCVKCGSKPVQVHHERYPQFPKKFGDEPIEWLVSLCKPCHDYEHRPKPKYGMVRRKRRIELQR